MTIRRMKGVIRIDTKNTHGWQVRVEWDGKRHTKFFSDKKHGGRHKALVFALRHRDRVEKKMGKPDTDRVVYAKARTATGILGVHKDKRNNGFVARWSPKKNVVRKVFVSKKVHGSQARAIAQQIREEEMKKMRKLEKKKRFTKKLLTDRDGTP